MDSTSEENVLHYLNARPKLVLHPELLALAPLLASVPVYPPNARAYSILVASEESQATPGLYGLLMLVACMLCAGLLASFSERHPDWSGFGRHVDLGCGCGYLIIQFVSIACLMAMPDPSVPLTVLGLASGVLIVPIVLAWVRCYAMDLRNVMFHGAIVCAGSAILTWVILLLPPLACAIALLAATAIGAFAPLLMRTHDAETNGRPRGTSASSAHTSSTESHDASPRSPVRSILSLLSIIWLPLLGFLVYIFMVNIYRGPFPDAPMSSEFAGAIMASALTLVLCLARLKTPLVIVINTTVIPLCVAICIVLGSFPAGSTLFFIGAFTVFAPLVFFSTYALASLVVVSTRGEFPQPFIVGVGLLASSAIAIVAVLISKAWGDIANFGEIAWIAVCLYFAIAILKLGRDARRRAIQPAHEHELDADTAEGVAMAGSDMDEQNAGTRDAQSIELLFARHVSELGETYGLTEREVEILSYLARGFNSTYIASCLFISSNTVRTHARNIYRKLGISTRSELLALVGRDNEGEIGGANENADG